MASVECSITFSNGQAARKTENVEGEGKQYMASMLRCLTSLKEEVNTVLSEQVAIEKSSTGTDNQKRSSEDMITDDGKLQLHNWWHVKGVADVKGVAETHT